jgi:hypothetical protein
MLNLQCLHIMMLQMTLTEFVLLFVLGFVAISFLLSRWLRKTRLVYITDFQAGLRYKDGVDCIVLFPGTYRERTEKAPITVVDKRPTHFLVERIFYQDALQSPSVISFAGAVRIIDPALAINASKEPINAAMARIREELKLAAPHSLPNSTPSGRELLAKTIQDEINEKLQAAGIEVCGLEVTETWSRPTPLIPTSKAN